MRFDWTLTLGAVIQIATIIVATAAVINAVTNRIELLRATLQTHADALKKHDTALSLYESRVFELVSDLQRLIGRFEVLEHQQSLRKL